MECQSLNELRYCSSYNPWGLLSHQTTPTSLKGNFKKVTLILANLINIHEDLLQRRYLQYLILRPGISFNHIDFGYLIQSV